MSNTKQLPPELVEEFEKAIDSFITSGHVFRYTQLKTKCAQIAVDYAEEEKLKMIDEIEQMEIGIPIDRFTDDKGNHITKREYGRILIQEMCKQLRKQLLKKKDDGK